MEVQVSQLTKKVSVMNFNFILEAGIQDKVLVLLIPQSALRISLPCHPFSLIPLTNFKKYSDLKIARLSATTGIFSVLQFR